MEQITLLLAAGDPSLLRGLRMRLEIEPGFAVTGEAPALEQIERLAADLTPDVVVLDTDAPGTPRPALERVRALATTVPVVVVSLDDRQQAAAAALEAGAAAFVRKHDPTDVLIAAIRSAASPSGDRRGAR